MSNFAPSKEHLRNVILFHFHSKESAAESYKMLVETYGDHAPSNTTCKEWFRRFKDNDFDVCDKERPGQSKKFEDPELQALLDEDPCQTQKQFAEALGVCQKTITNRLKAMGKILKCGNWVPHQLNDRQMENRRV